MTERRRSGRSVVMVAMVVLLGGLLAVTAPIDVGPAHAAGPCSGNGLYDQTAKRQRTPTPDAAGHVYPLVTIHGITGTDQDFDNTIDLSYTDAHPQPPRSLLDLLAGSKTPSQSVPAGLPHVHVYSFSYTPDSLRWIDDPRVGPKFAGAIDCLYQAYGVPVSVVAHSMGGLVTRWVANTTDTSGVSRAKKLGKVVTLGTPYLGSLLSEVASDAEALAASNPSLAPTIWALRYLCGTLGTETGKGSCGLIPMLASLNSQAGQALRYRSARIQTLAHWPPGPSVADLAGSIKVPFSLLGSPFNAPVDLGDLAVTTDSATADPGPTRTFECRYDSTTKSIATQLQHIFGLASPQDRQAQLGRLIGFGPCYHSHLMRNVAVTNEVLGQLDDWITEQSAAATCTEGAVLSGREASGSTLAADIASQGRSVGKIYCAHGYAAVALRGGDCANQLGCGVVYLHDIDGAWHVVEVGSDECDVHIYSNIPGPILQDLCAHVPPYFPSDDMGSATYCVIDTTPLNLRIGPGIEYRSLTAIPVTACDVHDAASPPEFRNATNGKPWRRVTWNEYQGWVINTALAPSVSRCLTDAEATTLFEASPAQGLSGTEHIHLGVCRENWAVGAIIASDGSAPGSAAFKQGQTGWAYVTSAGPLSMFCSSLREAGAPTSVLKDPFTGCAA